MRARWTATIAALAIALAACSVVALSVGSVKLPPHEVAAILASQVPVLDVAVDRWWSRADELIVLQLRLPRVLAAVMVGAALAISGAVLQGVFRNPLADPYVLGIASGAGLGGVLATIMCPWPALAAYARPMLAAIAALLTVFSVYVAARVGGRVPVLRLVLAGIAVSSLLSAVTMYLLFVAGERGHIALAWLFGSLAVVEGRWDLVVAAGPVIAACSVLMVAFSRDLNAMSMGEDHARYLGVDVELVKRALLVLSSVATASAVALGGVIGFVGLIVPHTMRLLVGPDHRVLLPSSALAGGVLLTSCDAVIRARVIVPTGELPIGTITAMMGCPFFLYLLVRSRGAGG